MSHHEFTTVIALNDGEVQVEVEFEFQPQEPQTQWYPGCHEAIQIESAKVDSQEIPDWVYNCISNQIIDDAWDFIKKQKEQEAADYGEYLYEQKRYA